MGCHVHEAPGALLIAAPTVAKALKGMQYPREHAQHAYQELQMVLREGT